MSLGGVIIGSWDVQPLGMRQAGTWHLPEGEEVREYVPIRRATHEEWMAEQRSAGHPIPDDHERAAYYYEVSFDGGRNRRIRATMSLEEK